MVSTYMCVLQVVIFIFIWGFLPECNDMGRGVLLACVMITVNQVLGYGFNLRVCETLFVSSVS